MSENLMKSLEITLKGMVAIFIAMGIIFLFVYFFNKLMNINPEEYAEVDNKDLFAKISNTLGKLSIYTCVVLGLIFGIPGIVFGLLGKKSEKFNELAKTGVNKSIIGTIIGLVALVVAIVLITILSK